MLLKIFLNVKSAMCLKLFLENSQIAKKIVKNRRCISIFLKYYIYEMKLIFQLKNIKKKMILKKQSDAKKFFLLLKTSEGNNGF